MFRGLLCVGLLVVAFAPFAGSKSIDVSPAPETDQAPDKDAQQLLAQVPRLTIHDQRDPNYWGTVTAISGDSVVILKHPRLSQTMEFPHPPRNERERAIQEFWLNQWDKAPARTFRVDLTLPDHPERDRGVAAHGLGQHRGHKLSEICVGDQVWLNLTAIDGCYECYKISIVRRPGGKVPPVHDELTPERCRHHIVCNTLQFAEERAVPQLPGYFATVGLRFVK